MSNTILFYIMGITTGLFLIVIIAYIAMQKVLSKTDIKRIKKLKAGTQEKRYTSDILYQKLYIYFVSIPFLNRYVLKTLLYNILLAFEVHY